MALSDFDLNNYLKSGRLVINPLKRDAVQQNGVDLHIGSQVALPIKGGTLDLAWDEPRGFYRVLEIGGEGLEIPPYTSILLHTEEYLKMPNDLVAICGLRSTFARLGFISPVTYVDAGFEGELTIETFWSKPHPVKIYRRLRFLHVVFIKCINPVEKLYKGLYQGQKGVKIPKSLKKEVREAQSYHGNVK